MNIGLDDLITEEQRDQLLYRIQELYDNGALKIRDWMSIYEVFLDACNREKVRTMECLLMESINGSMTNEERGEAE